MTLVERCEKLARESLGDRRAKLGDLIIEHTERVVALVHTESLKCAAWLHDVVEDTDVTLLQLAATHKLRPWLVGAVDVLTKRENERGEAGYSVYISRILDSRDAIALLVKRADLIDHLRPSCPESHRPRYTAALERIENRIQRVLESDELLSRRTR